MNNKHILFKAMSDIDDDIIEDAMSAQANKNHKGIIIGAVSAVLAVSVALPVAVTASRAHPAPVPVPTVTDTSVETEAASDDEVPTDVIYLEHVPNAEVISIEDIVKEEPFSEFLPTRIIPGMVQTLGQKSLYDEIIDPLDKDPVGYRGEFYYDPDGVFTEDMKDIADCSHETFRKRVETHLNFMAISAGKFSDAMTEGSLYMGRLAITPDQVTVEYIAELLARSPEHTRLIVREGDYYVMYEFHKWYDAPVPSAEEFYDMISSAELFNQ